MVYRIPCGQCDRVYIGETKRRLEERLKEHCADTASNLSAIAEHKQETGHRPDIDNISVLCLEDKVVERKVREAIAIKKETNPTLNRDGGVNSQESTNLYWKHHQGQGHHLRPLLVEDSVYSQLPPADDGKGFYRNYTDQKT